ncbi:unnamed protein product [Lasius platythorax]|uniref:Charged multivesicular body protein 6 n=1 Tax=Lasius platythorax TaxID=488582 RepID=A0AAV2P5J0_9HYME
MGIFFAKKKQASRVTEQDKAILQVKQTRDKIKQYQRKIEQSLEKERLLAKELLKNGRKDRALLLLRKKKYQEQVLSRADGQLENLERMVHDLEFAQVEMKVVDGLRIEDNIDEDEIETELDALLETEFNEKTPEIPKNVILPDVPKDLPEENKNRTKEKIQESIAVMA